MNTTLTYPIIQKKECLKTKNKNIYYSLNKTQKLLEKYAELSECPIEYLTGKTRHADIMLTRKAIWLKMRKEGCTLKEIAEIFNRTHPTIISGIYNIQDLLQIKDKQAVEEISKLNREK